MATTAESTPAPVRALRTLKARVLYYLCFVGAVICLSRAIHFGRFLTGHETSDLAVGAVWAFFGVWAGALLACVWVLGLFVYEGERAKGTLNRRVAAYERVLARQIERGEDN